MVHPAVALPEGHRIIVALRTLRDHDGRLIPPSSAFAAALDGTPEPMARLGDLQRVREGLRRDDIGEDDLFLAWDFTVASADSLAGRALSMRAQAYATLDGAAPTFPRGRHGQRRWGADARRHLPTSPTSCPATGPPAARSCSTSRACRCGTQTIPTT